MRIEIIGGMGVGKTTLCKALENYSLRCIYESLEKNPYLELSYNDPESFGFYSQISFILGNFYTAVQAQEKGGITFLDYSTITDKAYASLFLQGKARSIALQMIDFLEEKEGRADLYLYLTCSPETQIKRIRGRNRSHERGVSLEFIEQLDSYVTRYVHMAEMQGARILNVDTEAPDIRYDEDYVTALTMKIRHLMQSPASWPQGAERRPVFSRGSRTVMEEKAPLAQRIEMAEAV